MEDKLFILIGSTGNGKSTLGSFLIDPERALVNPIFRRANSNKPQTQSLEISLVRSDQHKLYLMDTPGLNESNKLDDEHMHQLFNKIKEIGQIGGFILCIKITNKIDQPMIELLNYYKKIFGSIMLKNMIVVLTDCKMDNKSIHKRKIDHFDIEQCISNINITLQNIFNVTKEFIVVTIDGIPDKDNEKEWNYAMETRKMLMKRLDEMKVVDVKSLKLAKTVSMKYQDKLNQSTIVGNIIGFSEAIKNNCKDIDYAVIEGILKIINLILIKLEKINILNTEMIIHQIEIQEKEIIIKEVEELTKKILNIKIDFNNFIIEDFENYINSLIGNYQNLLSDYIDLDN